MQSVTLQQHVQQFWQDEVLPTITRYIEIPNQSPLFDPDWKANGHMDRAVELVRQWVQRQDIPGSKLEVFEEPGRTPMLLLEVEGSTDETVMLYGHLDKQPAMEGWDEGKGPWKPVLENGKLFGRGGADDGYAIFAVVSAIQALKATGQAHPRLMTLIECCEESGSVDLPYYVEQLAERIGTPGLVICLDSGCGNYDQLWLTTSLRGVIGGELSVRVLKEGVHSGSASGIVPSSVRILRLLLERLEDATTGQLKPEWLSVTIPPNRLDETRRTAEALGEVVYREFPFAPGMQPASTDVMELLLNRTWRPTLCFTGQAGMPPLEQAGNVLRPQTTLKLSVRLPPSLAVEGLEHRLKSLFEENPPYGATVRFKLEKGAAGWEAPAVAPWLARSMDEASSRYFGRPACYQGEGGSIPFMGMLGEKFPEAQFMITGVLGPKSNAHGPNEFLDLATGANVTCCVAQVLADFVQRKRAE